MDIKKHVGRIKNTDARCVVVFHQIPNRETHALIVNTDVLPDPLHEALMEAVNSPEGQQADDIGEVLSRRIYTATGTDILNTLHASGRLSPYPVENIVMYPYPNQPIPLPEILVHINKKKKEAEASPSPKLPEKANYNRFKEDMEMREREEKTNIAMTLLNQASMLDGEAQKKRIEAYKIAPWLQESAPETEIYSTPQVQSNEISDVEEFIDETSLNHDDEILKMIGETKQEFDPEQVVYEDGTFHHEVTDSDIQEFLVEATKRELKKEIESKEANAGKRPVGRPRKNAAGK